MARLSIDVSDQDHTAIKTMAAMHGKTIAEFVLERVFEEETGSKATLRAMRELREGKNVNRYNSVKEMLADINND